MRDQVFFEGPERSRRLSRYWLLLVLSAVIASVGVVSDSTATVIGAMIVAPLMTPILGIVLAVVLADVGNLRRCLLLLITGAAVVAGLSWLLVPPLAVVGLTLESGAPRQALGAFLLFTTNVVAILASGIVVMALYRAYRPADQATSPAFHRIGAVAVIACLLLAVIVPLSVNSDRVNKTTIRQNEVQAVAEQRATGAGWFVAGVTTKGEQVLVEATGPSSAPSLARLRHDLDAAGLTGLDVRAHLTIDGYQPLPR